METFILLLLSSLIGLFILRVFRSVSLFTVRKHKSITDEPIVREESALETNVNKCSRPIRIFIPNVLARWPWPRRINPHYSVLKKEADAWITSFQAFSPRAQDAFNRCEFSKRLPPYSAHILILFDRSPRLFSSSYSQKR